MFDVTLLNGRQHKIDADEHSIEPAVTTVSGGGPEVVRFWNTDEHTFRDAYGGGKRKTRELVSVIPLSHIEIIRRA